MASPTLSLDNEVFAKFAFYAGVVLLKTVFMGIWTARFRIANKVCGSIEKNKKMREKTLKIGAVVASVCKSDHDGQIQGTYQSEHIYFLLNQNICCGYLALIQ